MNSRYIISTLIAVGLISIVVCTLNLGKKLEAAQPEPFIAWDETGDDDYSDYDDGIDDDTTEAYYDYTPIEVPATVQNLYPDAAWEADTLCVVGDKVYYHAYIVDMPGSVIYVDDKVLIESTNLELCRDEDNPRKFKVQAGCKSIDVDFTDPKSVALLSRLSHRHTDFDRYRKPIEAEFGRKVLYCLEVDYPKTSVTNSREITKWLTDVMLASLTPEKKQTISPKYIRYESVNTIGRQYKGGVGNKDALANFMARYYFNTVRREYGTDDEDYPAALFSNLSLRVDQCNKRFVTYQMHTKDYYGGVHGYYTVRLISYDHVHHQEIGWTYLFKPQSFDAILDLIDTEAQKDWSYLYWTANIMSNIDAVDDADNLTGEKVLPDLGLGKTGVVFSFQPYDIACFAAGSFHFTVPYKLLEPYLTDRAKWCTHP